jgi:hypothetical protein
MSDQSTTSDAQQGAAAEQSSQTQQGTYYKGPVTINWQAFGPHNAQCKVQLEFEGALVASNTLSPGDTNWDTGRHEASDSWCEASFELQVPTPGQEGQLDLRSLVWMQDPGGTNKTTNQLLGVWDYAP